MSGQSGTAAGHSLLLACKHVSFWVQLTEPTTRPCCTALRAPLTLYTASPIPCCRHLAIASLCQAYMYSTCCTVLHAPASPCLNSTAAVLQIIESSCQEGVSIDQAQQVMEANLSAGLNHPNIVNTYRHATMEARVRSLGSRNADSSTSAEGC